MAIFSGLAPLALVAFAASAGAEQAHKVAQLRQRAQHVGGGGGAPLHAGGFVRMLEYKHQLRVCNAYPMSASLDVYRGKDERLTGDGPMPYKTCRDFHAPLRAGDKLEFRLGDQSGGTFSVSDLPNNDAVLLLVVHRHDTLSTAVAFESHVFADLDRPQVAVIDTYRGKARATPKIMDDFSFLARGKQEGKKAQQQQERRSEDLRYDSVVAVSPGVYDVVLDGQDGAVKGRSHLVALKHESYVVLRTGVESQVGASFPEELVIFPQPDPAPLQSAAAGGRRPPLSCIATLLATALLAVLTSGLGA